MPIQMQCEQCGKQLRIPETAVGKKIRCPACRAIFIANSPPAAVPSPPPAHAVPPPLPVPTPVVPVDAPEQVGIQVARPTPPPLSAVETPTPILPVRRRAFPPMRFPVIVVADRGKALQGRLDAEVTPEGLTLWQGKKEAAHVPVGSPARYLGKNRFVVPVEDHEMSLAAVPPRKYRDRLARDVVAFLREEKPSLREADYNMPMALYLVAVAPLSVALVAILWRIIVQKPSWAAGGIWGGIWGGVGGGLAGAAFAIVQREKWPLAGRVVLSLGLTAIGYVAFFLTLILSALAGGPRIDASAWKEFSPPGGRFRIEMPGTPVAKNQVIPGGIVIQMWAVELKNPDSTFVVGYEDIPLAQMNLIPLAQRFEGAKQGMLAKTPNSEVVSERQLTLKGHPGREYVLRVRGKRGRLVVYGYFVGNRFFMLLAGGQGYGPDSPDVQRFINSFQLLEDAGAVPPPKGGPPVLPPRGPVPSAKDIPGLAAYWPLDEGKGAKAADASGKGNDAMLVGSPIWEQGVRGKALSFNGRTDYLDLGKSPALNFPANGPFTISGWVRTRGGGAVVSFRNGRSGAPVIDLTIEGQWLSAVVRADGQEIFEARVQSQVAVADGQWHHFALTRDAGGRIELFVDSVSQGQGWGGNSAGAITTDLRAVGAELYWLRGVRMGQPYLTGAVDELAIFGRVLTVADIRRLAGR